MSSSGTGVGPAAHRNWRAFDAGFPRREGYEVLLAGDCCISGEIGDGECGPYAVLNTIELLHLGGPRAPLALRVWVHDPSDLPNFSTDDETGFHGGEPPDEIAALLALALGVRLRATDAIRLFSHGDPPGVGAPRFPVVTAPPVPAGAIRVLPRVGTRVEGQRLVNQFELDQPVIKRLVSYPKLLPRDAVTLVRAARAYRDALWLAEIQPELSWLLLVAALEAAATSWKQDNAMPVGLAELEPKLAAQLAPFPGALPIVEKFLRPRTKSTAAFIAFGRKFAPREGPKPRPKFCGFPWQDPERIGAALATIYAHRSRALHEGIPFPLPMCEPGYEIPMGEGTAARGGVWMIEDMPMLLNAFEWLARHALLAWWDELVLAAP